MPQLGINESVLTFHLVMDCRERQLPFDDIEKLQNTVSLSGPQPSLGDYLKPLGIAVDIVGYVF